MFYHRRPGLAHARYVRLNANELVCDCHPCVSQRDVRYSVDKSAVQISDKQKSERCSVSKVGNFLNESTISLEGLVAKASCVEPPIS